MQGFTDVDESTTHIVLRDGSTAADVVGGVHAQERRLREGSRKYRLSAGT